MTIFKFLNLAAWLFGRAVLTQHISGVVDLKQCPHGKILRKDIRDLTTQQRLDWSQCFVTLSNRGDLEHLHDYHGRDLYWSYAHFSPLFLLWHRLFIRDLEILMLSECNLDFGMPYWAWDIDSVNPWRSIIFSEEFFGTHDTTTKFVNTSIFQYGMYNYNITRDFNENMTSFFTTDQLESILDINKSFSKMSVDFEYSAHGLVHHALGGNMRSGPISTHDPLFWLHHTFCDLLFYQWQTYNNNTFKFDSQYYDRNRYVSRDTFIQPWNVTINETLVVDNFCYVYSPLESQARNLASDLIIDNEHLKNITIPLNWCYPIPECNDTTITRVWDDILHNNANFSQININYFINIVLIFL